MSSEIYEFDGCFFNDTYSSFNDPSSPIDIMQAFQEHNYSYTPLTSHENLDETDQIIPTLLSSSPPSNQLDNLSLYQKGISVNSSNHVLDFCPSEVKIEKSQPPLYDHYCFGESDNAFKMMQRSYSSNSFQHGRSNGVFYQPKFNGLIDAPYLDSRVLTSSDHSFSSNMRRVCSTGDLHSQKVKETSQRLSSSPLSTESSFMEETNFKVGRYNAEERKEKIMKYRAKRTQRNFNKTIKYACRKTLADNRPRIRGRFARNDEPGELPKSTTFHQYGVDDELWMDGFHEEDGERMTQFFNTYSSMAQFQQFSFIHN
ncbi:putative transcription factor C2C2-CO-like family [Helianthus annuus]|uniref:zinc finger protein CONSTANS-LIKE 2 n=1 Tax=Helianthus annuus TaxID=4232 RepID=UPI000B8FA779|nr:zinc finger protein CONSTANS-LIKE 2 [Helianthus annuus]KAJ0857244.1 putative transcription factor C2C2-CO-like family [Helianthus annuus]